MKRSECSATLLSGHLSPGGYPARRGFLTSEDGAFCPALRCQRCAPKIHAGKSLIVMKHVRLGDHQASVCMEEAFWLALKEIAAAQGTSMAQLIRRIDSERRERQHFNLSSATRLFVLDYYRSRCGLERPDTSRDRSASPQRRLMRRRSGALMV